MLWLFVVLEVYQFLTNIRAIGRGGRRTLSVTVTAPSGMICCVPKVQHRLKTRKGLTVNDAAKKPIPILLYHKLGIEDCRGSLSSKRGNTIAQ